VPDNSARQQCQTKGFFESAHLLQASYCTLEKKRPKKGHMIMKSHETQKEKGIKSPTRKQSRRYHGANQGYSNQGYFLEDVQEKQVFHPETSLDDDVDHSNDAYEEGEFFQTQQAYQLKTRKEHIDEEQDLGREIEMSDVEAEIEEEEN